MLEVTLHRHIETDSYKIIFERFLAFKDSKIFLLEGYKDCKQCRYFKFSISSLPERDYDTRALAFDHGK